MVYGITLCEECHKNTDNYKGKANRTRQNFNTVAVTDFDNLTSITRERVLPKIIDQIGKDHPLLGRFFNSAKQWNGGTTIQIPVKYRHNAQGGSYSGLELLDTGQEATRTRAKFEVKQEYQPIVLSNIDLAKNGGGDDTKIADLMGTEMEEAHTSIEDKFGTQIFGDGTGNGGKNLDGLIAAVDDSTNIDTYGDIVRSTYTWWKANYTASVGSLMLSDLATMYSSCKSGNDTPSILVTSETVWDAYEAILQSQVRYQSTDGNAVSADGGMKALSFRLTPMIADEYCTAGYIYFLNEKYLNLYYMNHPKHSTDSRGFTVTPMREPTNQDGQVGFILWYGNLINSMPRRSGVLRGVTA